MASKCPRCGEVVDFLPTVPAYLPAKEAGWFLLCPACYRLVLDQEPPPRSAALEWYARRRRRDR